MARPARPKRPSEPLPPPLPPETRPVGQLIAETIKLYGRRFWVALALGLPIGIFGAVARSFDGWTYAIFSITVGALLLTLTYVGAAVIAADRPIPRRRLLVAFAAGVVVFLPFPALVLLYILPAVAWLALVGLAVPAAVIEGTGFVGLAEARLPARARRLRALARHDGGARDPVLPLDARARGRAQRRQRPGGRDRAAPLRRRALAGRRAGREPPLLRPGRPSRVGPSAIEEEPRCRPTSCSRA